MLNTVFDRVENIVGKGENVGHNIFKRLLPKDCCKWASCGKELTLVFMLTVQNNRKHCGKSSGYVPLT